jgi:GTP-binding protein EngB required for normal cell division
MDQEARQAHSDPTQSTIRHLLDAVSTVTTRFHIASLNRQIAVCQALFSKNTLIDIAILGQFKAGKSSFINSLLGEPLLPIGVIPVTTVITRLRHGSRPRAIVTHFDGAFSEIGINEIEGFISEEKNPANEKNVEVVDIELPSLQQYAGLRLVDTPGLGIVFRYNTETSEEWLPEVGAAIVAVSADRPLSENDIKLVRTLMAHTPRILLLLTKADLLSQDEQKKVVKFFKDTVQREFGRDFPVYLYSTVSGTDLLKARVDKLILGLSENRDQEFRHILQHKVASLAKACLDYLEIALKTSQQADSDREELKKLILTEKLNYDLMRSELFLIARESTLQTRTFIAMRLEAERPEFTRKLITRLREEMLSWQGNLWSLTRQYEAWLEENLTQELTRLSKKEHRHFFGTLDKAYRGISRSLEFFRVLLGRNIEQVLGVKLSETEWEIDVPEPSHPDVAFTKVFDFHFDLLWFLIPMVIFRGVFERQFLKKIPGIARMHLSRLAYQWEVRINRTIEEVRSQALTYVQEELATIDVLLSGTAGQTDDIRGALRDIESDLAHLDGMGTGAQQIPTSLPDRE